MNKLLSTVVAFAIAFTPVVAHSRTIYHDEGGVITDYTVKLLQTPNDEQIRIIGYCGSACTIFLSKPNVCIAETTKLLFHSASLDKPGLTAEEREKAIRMANRYLISKYPEWLRKIIAENGGLTKKEIILTYSDLKPYLPLCA